MIEEAAATGGIAGTDHGITGGVYHQPLPVLLLRNFPDLLDAEAVMLGVTVLVQFKLVDNFLTEVTVTSLRKNCIAGVKFEARFIGRFLLTTGIDSHIAGGDSLNAAIVIIENFSCCKTGEYFGTQLHCLFCQPAAQIAQGNDVVTVVVHRPWQQQSRKAKR